MKELLLEQNENQQKEESKYYDVLHAPYIAGFSEQLARDLKQIKIGVTFQKGNTLYNSVCKLKPEKHPDDRKNIISCLGCKSCNQHYLGENNNSFLLADTSTNMPSNAINKPTESHNINVYKNKTRNIKLIGKTEYS